MNNSSLSSFSFESTVFSLEKHCEYSNNITKNLKLITENYL